MGEVDADAARLEGELIGLVRDSAPVMRALVAVRTLGLASWCIGAGAVRGLVWDRLQGRRSPTPVADVDVVHFDPTEPSSDSDRRLEARLSDRLPGVAWEVVNQAFVHRWLRIEGREPEPFGSLHEAVGSWPETATCVGVWLDESDRFHVVAPLGLRDLFGQVVRWNPRRVGAAVFRERVARKRFAELWPGVRVVWPGEDGDERIR